MAAKKTLRTKRISVDDTPLGADVRTAFTALEQHDARRKTLMALLQQAVRLAGKAAGVPPEYQFDPDSMEYFKPAEPEGETDGADE